MVSGRVGRVFSKWWLQGLRHCLSLGLRVRLHPDPCAGHLSHRLTPKHHSLLQPRLHSPCRLGGPRVGGLATSLLPSRGSPTQGQKMGKPGDKKWESRGTKNGKTGGQLEK